MTSLQEYGTFLNEKASQELLERQQRRRHRRRLRYPINAMDTRIWMAAVPDDTYLSALTIPGTHDSAAFGSIWPFVSTQNLNLTQQLDCGVRYLDLRCGLRADILEMVHGTAILGRTLASCLDDIYTWLDTHQSEALIIQIKPDREPEKSTITFADAIWQLIDANLSRWLLGQVTPRLSSARGRIQLFRRFSVPRPTPRPAGIDVSRWADNPPTPFRIRHRAGFDIVIQDHYNPVKPCPLPAFVDEKFAAVENMIDLAIADDPDADSRTWYLNFCSAYQMNVYHQSFPHQVAVGAWSGFTWIDGINRRLQTKLLAARGTRRRYGVMLLDFLEQPDPELVGQLIATNFGPKPGAMSRRKRRRRGSKAAVLALALALLLVFLAGCVVIFVHGRVQVTPCPPWLHACRVRSGISDGTSAI